MLLQWVHTRHQGDDRTTILVVHGLIMLDHKILHVCTYQRGMLIYHTHFAHMTCDKKWYMYGSFSQNYVCTAGCYIALTLVAEAN